MESVKSFLDQSDYFKMFRDYGLKGISYFTVTSETFSQVGENSVNLLEGFSWSSDRVNGEVAPEKVRNVVELAMDPIKSFYRAGLVVTGALVIGSRLVQIVPIVNLFGIASIAMGVSAVFSGLITWEVSCALREMDHLFSDLNKRHLNEESALDFNTFVDLVDSYSRQILSNLWLLSGLQEVKTSLTNWKPHLTEQIENQGKGEEKKSPWEIASRYFPILPIICRVAVATDRATKRE